jgi:hypothetical protein
MHTLWLAEEKYDGQGQAKVTGSLEAGKKSNFQVTYVILLLKLHLF